MLPNVGLVLRPEVALGGGNTCIRSCRRVSPVPCSIGVMVEVVTEDGAGDHRDARAEICKI